MLSLLGFIFVLVNLQLLYFIPKIIQGILMQQPTFATTLNCIDGRAQAAAESWIRQNIGIDHIDQISEPGVDRLLASGDVSVMDPIRHKVGHSVGQNASNVVVIVGHDNYADAPADAQYVTGYGCPDTHRSDIHRAINRVASWKIPAYVLGLRLNDEWKVEVVDEVLV